MVVSPSLELSEVPSPHRARRPIPARRRTWWCAALAAVTVLLGIAIPFAPVTASDPVVTWPQAGRSPVPTALPLSPPRPLSLEAAVPCAALRAVGTGDALRTVPAAADPEGGLTIAAGGGRISVLANGSQVFAEPVPAGACAYRVAVTAAGLEVSRDGRELTQVPGVLVPEVSVLSTAAAGLAESAGLGVTLHTDDRYNSTPTGLKTALLLAHLAALVATLVLARRIWGRVRVPRLRPRPVDLVVAAVAASWVLLGPMGYDDAWYALMSRNAAESGYLGNYVYMFNVTENPFVLSQYLMQFWGGLGEFSLWWLRLLPLAYGLLTWVFLRVFLEMALGRASRHRWVPWALGLAFLSWWLPYGMSLRPEPLILCLTAATMLLAELARRRESVPAAAAATLVAALGLSCSPSGLVAWAPLVPALPWLWRWLRDRSWTSRAAAGLTLVAAGTALVPVGFADATFGDVVEATKVHRWYYASFAWFEEWRHVESLMTGPWALRLPVLMTLGVGLLVALGRGRRTAPGTIRCLMLSSAAITVLAMALLALSPTKWVVHFGVVAAPAIVLLTTALLRSPLPRTTGVVASIAATGVLIAVAAAGFSGPNIWKPFSDRGQSFGNHLPPAPSKIELTMTAPHVGDVFLHDAKLWVGLALAIAGFGLWRRRRHLGVLLRPERGVLLAIALLLVAGMVAVFGYAPFRQAPGWTVARGGVEQVTSGTGGLADHVQVLADADVQPPEPAEPAVLGGDFATTAPLPVPPAAPGAVWHSNTVPATGGGSLTTGWYPVPATGDATHVTVPVLGERLSAHRLSVQADTPTGVVDLPLDREAAPGPNGPLGPDDALGARHWQELAVPLPRPVRAVRVVVEQRGPWLAVGQPRLTKLRPVTTVTDGRVVFADQLSAVLWPDVEQAPVADGITTPPAVRLSADEHIDAGVLSNSTFTDWGGNFATSTQTATAVRMISVLPGGPETPPWGNVDRVLYAAEPLRVDVEHRFQDRAGWTRLPTLAGEDYIGREYTG
ncbi:arabinosyltransferase domain-containing protein [Saccharopolyspora flava]|uniref:Arabinosyltransferase B n=1 Tax=Saccharopolyspora flava TaxID=95161 RepID=A0A1I6V1Z0_9PSEU|nr:arabinosyltransferase domain-containing protein [Saccharopolyspora flava]SFT07675.1 arabinosyltransferase B [Saccharopolyspora flava]